MSGMKNNYPAALKRAMQNYKRAGEKLSQETSKAFPVGSSVVVELGRAIVVGEVISSGGCWWHQPDRVKIRNLATGKERKFSARGSEARITSRPKETP